LTLETLVAGLRAQLAGVAGRSAQTDAVTR